MNLFRIKKHLKKVPFIWILLSFLYRKAKPFYKVVDFVWGSKAVSVLFNCLLKKALENNKALSIDVLKENKRVYFVYYYDDNFSFLTSDINFVDYKEEKDIVILWGVKPSFHKIKIILRAIKEKTAVIVGEDAFLRSQDIAVNGAKGCGFIFDTTGVYYDSRLDNCIDSFLNTDWIISNDEKDLSLKAMSLIKDRKVSKYNVAKPVDLVLPGTNKHKVLVIDQRKGDQSITGARANASSFKKMIEDAVQENPNSDIILKTHPDGNSGKLGGYYQKYKVKHKNVYKFTENTNPVSLLEKIDKVYVCSSGMGFEAAILGKEVICYGSPFYSGWGITEDRGYRRKRNKKRTIEEVFYSAYIQNSIYFSPINGERCDIITLINQLADVSFGEL